MGSVHIGIGHDNDLVVAQLCDIEIFMDSGSEGGDHGLDLGVAVDAVHSGLFHV